MIHPRGRPLAVAILTLALAGFSSGGRAESAGTLPLPHGQPVHACAFSPDGKTLATGCSDKIIRLWDAATGKEVQQLKGHQGAVTCIAFSANGQRLVSSSSDEKVVRTQQRFRGFQQRVAGGCQFDLDIAALVDAAGFEIVALRNLYLKGQPKAWGCMYVGVAVNPADS